MNLKQIEDKIAASLGGADQALTAAAALAPRIPDFINAADEAVKFLDDAAKKLAGSDKLALVKAMAEAALSELGLGASFTSLWAVLGPIVTVVVQLRKLGFIKF